MRALLLATVAISVSSLAMADPSQVPALANANAMATGPGANANATASATSAPSSAVAPVPTGMPPAVNRLSPSALLNAKEKTSASMAQAWRNHNDRPSRGEDGVLRWTFGASLPSVVCSPLQVCDIALQAGEVVNSIHVGDKIRWSVLPAVAGTGVDRTTHLIVKPSDAGLVSSILVYTDQRIYSIKLISTQTQWTPLTGFVYPDTAQTAWANYGATMEAIPGGNAAAPSGATSDIDFDYSISGPLRGGLSGFTPRRARPSSNFRNRCGMRRLQPWSAVRTTAAGSPLHRNRCFAIGSPATDTWSMGSWTGPNWFQASAAGKPK
jgi:type IV secretion system protein TrbG